MFIELTKKSVGCDDIRSYGRGSGRSIGRVPLISRSSGCIAACTCSGGASSVGTGTTTADDIGEEIIFAFG